jgi:Mg2+ and Co2+ transporter CorA
MKEGGKASRQQFTQRGHFPGIFVYDTEVFNLDRFWSKERLRSKLFAPFLIAWLSETYLDHVRNEARVIEHRIEAISTSNSNGKRSSLSKLMLELDECNHLIRMHIKPDTAFSLELVNWTSALMRSYSLEFKPRRLLDLISKHPELHPDQLRERIVQTRAEITDLAAQQRQEQDEIQRERAYQLQELSIKIAEDSRRDSRTMRGIAWVTMAFLPATFVTSFFGMNFFDGISGRPVFDGTSRNIWVFFVIALPISAMVLVIFWWWDRKTRILEHIEQEAREKALSS